MTTDEPDEASVRRAVVYGVEHLEGPDRARLAVIERRLLAGSRPRQRRRPLWWGVLLAGLAAGAAAGYWGFFAGPDGLNEPSSGAPASRSDAATVAGDEAPAKGGQDNDSGSRDDNNPIIYMGQ